MFASIDVAIRTAPAHTKRDHNAQLAIQRDEAATDLTSHILQALTNYRRGKPLTKSLICRLSGKVRSTLLKDDIFNLPDKLQGLGLSAVALASLDKESRYLYFGWDRFF